MSGPVVAVQMTVNGEAVAVATVVERTLLDVLRDDLGLTGTKTGCGMGACGACNVLIDGEAHRACLSLAVTVAGRSVTTIEGLAEGGRPSVVQQAFLDAGAIQCGFCMPGMIVSATELLANNPRPSRDEIRVGLSGNLCRCSGYVKVVEAVELAARRLPAR
jgi:carbon-monoxide dehydrogenase small subunit